MRQWRQTGLTGILTAASHPQTEMVVVSASDDVVATPVLFAMLNTFFALA
jgi:molybdopterin-guanine dinucleotide biosynthesis protein A